VSRVVEEGTEAHSRPPKRQGDLRAVADALSLLARLVALKATSVLPDQDTTVIEPETINRLTPGRTARRVPPLQGRSRSPTRDAATEGARSFLGLVSTEVIPGRAAPDRPGHGWPRPSGRSRTAQRYRPLPVGITLLGGGQGSASCATVSCWDRSNSKRSSPGFSSRLEAVACFLALLEMPSAGEGDGRNSATRSARSHGDRPWMTSSLLDVFGRATVPEGTADAEPEDLAPALEALCFALGREGHHRRTAAAIWRRSPAAIARSAGVLAMDLRRSLWLMLHAPTRRSSWSPAGDGLGGPTRPPTRKRAHRA